MRTRPLIALLILAVVAAAGWVLYRGFGPIPGPSQCVAKVGDVEVNLEPDQARNAAIIAAIGVRRNLPARAVSIALATAMQESKLHNLDYGDRDSLGLFQQRPSQGWGTPKQVRNPYYATNAFYDVLAKIEGFESMRITDAAQKVQRSAYPQAYQAHADDARALASALTGYSPGGRFSCTYTAPTTSGTPRQSARALKRAFGALQVTEGPGAVVSIRVPNTASGRRLGWSVAAFAVAHAKPLHLRSISFDARTWRTGSASSKGWQADDAATTRVILRSS